MGNPISVELFLQRARSRFGDQYDYAAMVYKSYKTPIRIRCTTHPVKEISITPEKHLQTTGGCKYCLRMKRIVNLERELNRASVEGFAEIRPAECSVVSPQS
ncbi:MAG: hypothetical protein WD136_01005 [Cyanobium sp.]